MLYILIPDDYVFVAAPPKSSENNLLIPRPRAMSLASSSPELTSTEPTLPDSGSYASVFFSAPSMSPSPTLSTSLDHSFDSLSLEVINLEEQVALYFKNKKSPEKTPLLVKIFEGIPPSDSALYVEYCPIDQGTKTADWATLRRGTGFHADLLKPKTSRYIDELPEGRTKAEEEREYQKRLANKRHTGDSPWAT